ncbi:MAG: ROK family protein [Firmicutes bacterium]|nr:ROK family protein [Bacillota bacterium]
MNYFLALDIGGTKISAAVFTEDGQIFEDDLIVLPTPAFTGNDSIYNAVAKAADMALTKRKAYPLLSGIGAASPGPLDTTTGTIIHAPLMGWENFHLAERLEADFHCPVMLDNDCNLGALAEQRVGVAKGKDSVFYVTMSTGVGGGFVLNGEIFHGFRDSSCEVGHMNIVDGGPDCPCGGKGCLELYASGTGLADRVRRKLINDPHTQTKIWELVRRQPDKITAKIITQAALDGDEYALSELAEVGRYMGIGLNNIVNLFDPEVIVIGGGFSKAHGLFEENMFKTMTDRAMQPYDPRKLIRYSVLCDKAVIWGAYLLISENKNIGRQQ